MGANFDRHLCEASGVEECERRNGKRENGEKANWGGAKEWERDIHSEKGEGKQR